MKLYHSFILLSCFILVSCIKKYDRTSALCDGKLYVETFNVNPAGVDAQYLTDSLNFRLYVGKFDNEHENFSYTCTGDSVTVFRIANTDTSTTNLSKIRMKVYNLKDLKRDGRLD